MLRMATGVLIATVFIGMAYAEQPSWPRFRGPRGSGVAHGKEPLPTHFGPHKNLVWKTPLPLGHSSPCVSRGRIFVTGFEKDAGFETLCLDQASGRILWRRSTAAEAIEKVHQVSSPASPTPAIDGERVYVYFGSFGLVCYDFEGKQLWQHPLPAPNLYFGSGTSPIVAGGRVLLNVDQEGESFLLALDARSGEEVWKTGRPLFGRGWSTPVHVRHNGIDKVLVLGSRRLTAYALSDGAARWSVGGLPPFTISSPVVHGDRLFLAATDEFGEPENVVQPPRFEAFAKAHDKNGDGKIDRDEIPADLVVVDRRSSTGAGDTKLGGWYFARVDGDKDGALTREEWDKFTDYMARWPAEFKVTVMAIRLGVEGDVSESHVLWREAKGVPEVPSPLVYEGYLYTVMNGGILFCRNAETGKLIYRKRLGSVGGYFASPVAGDGKLHFATDRGVVVVVKSGEAFEVLARNDLGEPIMATPALVGGQILVRTEGHLFAFTHSPAAD